MTDEEKVRAAWECVGIQWANIGGKRYGMAHSNGLGIPLQGFLTEDEIWSAAAAFTDERLEQIRQVEEEIALVSGVEKTTAAFIASIYVAGHIKQDAAKESPIWKRTLARLQGIREELRRGMK